MESTALATTQGSRQLTPADRRDRDRLTLEIKTGLRWTIPTALRLVEFLDRELYVETHGEGSAGFIAWGHDVLGIGKTYLYDLVRLGRVKNILSAIAESDTSELRESHARELSGQPEEVVQSVWAEVTADGNKPTARQVRDAIHGKTEKSSAAELSASIASTAKMIEKKFRQLDTADPACTLTIKEIDWLEANPFAG